MTDERPVDAAVRRLQDRIDAKGPGTEGKGLAPLFIGMPLSSQEAREFTSQIAFTAVQRIAEGSEPVVTIGAAIEHGMLIGLMAAAA